MGAAQRCGKEVGESILHRFCPSSSEGITLLCRGWIYPLGTFILSSLLCVQVAVIAKGAPRSLDAAEKGTSFRAAQPPWAQRLSHPIPFRRELIPGAWGPVLPAALMVLAGAWVRLAMDPAEAAALPYLLGRCRLQMRGPLCWSSPPALARCLSL